jgi:hypothetical protein
MLRLEYSFTLLRECAFILRLGCPLRFAFKFAFSQAGNWMFNTFCKSRYIVCETFCLAPSSGDVLHFSIISDSDVSFYSLVYILCLYLSYSS